MIKLEDYLGWKYGFDRTNHTFLLEPNVKYEVPKTFFKYYALTDYSIDALTNMYVYASHPAQLNDPFDCDRCLARIEDEENAKAVWEILYGTIRNVFSSELDFYDYTTKAFSTLIYNKWGVFSLTEKPDSMIMWSLYAQNDGFCLEWDVSKFPFKNSGPYPIHYVRNVMEASSLNYDAATLALIQCNVKQECWKYENEWRLMIFSPEGVGMQMFGEKAIIYNKSFPDAHNRKFKYPLSSLKSITLGMNFFKKAIENGIAVYTDDGEIHIGYSNSCNQTKVLNFLYNLNSSYYHPTIRLAKKTAFSMEFVPICVLKIDDLTYRIVELNV